MPTPAAPDAWPELAYQEWAGTKKTLQLYTQLAGKIRLALEPRQPEWLGVCLYPTSRGLTTSPMPWGSYSVEVIFDFFDHTISIWISDGRLLTIPLFPAHCVADFFEQLMGRLAEIGLEVDVWTKPQELADTTPLDDNWHDCAYEPEQAQRFFQVITAVRNVMDEWRSRLFARTGVQFWWGAFDLTVLLFNGKHAQPAKDIGYIRRYTNDAEQLAAGFWPGDDNSPSPIFYGYIYPQPPEASMAPVSPESAAWVQQMGEWILPYEDVRSADDPRRELLTFLDSLIDIAGQYGGWDLKSFKYTPPPPSERRW